MQRFPLLTLLLAGSVICVSTAFARPPHVSYIYPAGAQRGTTVDIKVGGHYLHDAANFTVDGVGIEASPKITKGSTRWFEGPVIPQPPSQRTEDYPVDYDGTLKVAADAPFGLREWSVATAQGATVPMKFVIGNLPELIEDEIDGTPIPQLVPLPVTINARTFPREDVDLWTFEVAAGQTVTCAIAASAIDSPVEAHLEVRDPAGQRIAEATGTTGADPVVRFTSKTAGRFTVQVHDANFGGLQHYVYRLTITAGAYADSVFPLGGRRGETLKLQLTGVGLDRTTFDLPLAANAAEQFSWRPDFAAASDAGFMLETSDWPEAIESAANNSTDAATAFAVPQVLNGRIESAGDIDHWKFEAKKSDSLIFEMHAAKLGSVLDSVVELLDATGKTIAESDDVGSDSDSRLVFTVPADAAYFVRIRDRVAGRGGADFGYRLHVLDAKTADTAPFSLEIQSQTAVANVDRDGELKLKVNVKRSSFNDEIALVLEGLPAGITVEGATVAAKQKNATITLKAAATATLKAASVRLIGKAKVGDTDRQAVATIKTQPATAEKLERLIVAVTLKTPFKLTAVFESKFAPRGSVYLRHYKIERGGFEGPLEISLADRQNRHLQGVTGPKIVVPAGVTEFDYPASLPPWLEVGRTSRTCLMAVGEVTDADGSKHKLAYSSQEQNDQIIVLTAPEEFSVVLEVPSIRAVAGDFVTVPLQVGRASRLNQPATIEVVPASHMRGIVAERLIVPADTTKAFLKIRFEEGAIGPFNQPLTLRATTMDERGLPVIHECPLEVVTDAPAASVSQVRKTAR